MKNFYFCIWLKNIKEKINLLTSFYLQFGIAKNNIIKNKQVQLNK